MDQVFVSFWSYFQIIDRISTNSWQLWYGKKTNILLMKKKKSKSVRTEDYHIVWRCDAGHIVRAFPYGMTGRKETYIDDIEIYASKVSWRNRRSTRETPYVSKKEKKQEIFERRPWGYRQPLPKNRHTRTSRTAETQWTGWQMFWYDWSGEVGADWMLKWHQIE